MRTRPIMLWKGRSKNGKTGDIPNGYAGHTLDEAERSCEGCGFRKEKCYYWMKNPRLAHLAMAKAFVKDPERYSLKNAMRQSSRMARWVRGAVGGDSNIFPREQVEEMHEEVQSFGCKGLLLYTHFPLTKGAHLKGLAMASSESLEEADEMANAGWRVFTAVPFRTAKCKLKKFAHLPVWNGEKIFTPEGRPVPVCPAQQPQLRRDCNSCGLCDATKHPGVEVIGSLMH